MTRLLIFKEILKQLYNKHCVAIMCAVKFIFALIVVLIMNYQVGYMPILKSPIIFLLVPVICAFLPVSFIPIVSCLLLLLHLSVVSAESVIVILVLIALMYVIYFNVNRNDGYILLLSVLFSALKLPCILPVVIGLTAAPITSIPLIGGLLINSVIQYVRSNYIIGIKSDDISMVNRYVQLIDGALKKEQVILLIVTSLVVVVVVYFIRRLSINYSWIVSIIVGTILYILILLLGIFVFDIELDIPIWWILLGTIFSVLIVLVFYFFIFAVDYSRTEYTQFEDSVYHYYVKAVPKVNLSIPEKKVKRINTRS